MQPEWVTQLTGPLEEFAVLQAEGKGANQKHRAADGVGEPEEPV